MHCTCVCVPLSSLMLTRLALVVDLFRPKTGVHVSAIWRIRLNDAAGGRGHYTRTAWFMLLQCIALCEWFMNMQSPSRHVTYCVIRNYDFRPSVCLGTLLAATVRTAKYCDEYVCLSVHSHISETTRPNFTEFLCISSLK